MKLSELPSAQQQLVYRWILNRIQEVLVDDSPRACETIAKMIFDARLDGTVKVANECSRKVGNALCGMQTLQKLAAGELPSIEKHARKRVIIEHITQSTRNDRVALVAQVVRELCTSD